MSEMNRRESIKCILGAFALALVSPLKQKVSRLAPKADYAIRLAQCDPDNLQIVYAIGSTDNVIIKSQDGGRTWSTIKTLDNRPLELWVADETFVFVGTNTGECIETRDGGATWTTQTEQVHIYPPYLYEEDEEMA